MSPLLKRLSIGLVLLVAVGLLTRTVLVRRADQALPTTSRADAALDLAPGDTVAARRIELTRTLEVSGGLKAVNSAVVKAKVAAEVQSLTVREGDSVQAGQVLGQLDTSELDLRLRQAEQTAASSRAQLDIANRALTNNRALVAQGFISATALETSISNSAAAQASLQAAQATADLARKARSDARLIAPISGQIAARLVQPGERVPVDARLLEIVDLSRLELEAPIAPEDVVALTIGRPASLHIDGVAAAVPARVARINPSAQAGSRSVLAYLTVDGQPALRQGLFARGRIEVERKSVLALPLSALRIDQALPYVLQVTGNKVQRTAVTLGLRGDVDGQPWVEVATGLAEGALVLTGSTGSVRDGTAVRLAAPPPTLPPPPPPTAATPPLASLPLAAPASALAASVASR